MKNIKILKRLGESIPKSHLNKTVFEYYVDNQLIDSTMETSAFLAVLNKTLIPDKENYKIQGNWVQSPTILVSGDRAPNTTVNTYEGQKWIFKLANTVIRFPAVPAYLDPLQNFSEGTFYATVNPLNRYDFTYTATSDLSRITHGRKVSGDYGLQYTQLHNFGSSRAATQNVYFTYDEYYRVVAGEVGTHGLDQEIRDFRPLSFWDTSVLGAVINQVYGATFTEKNTGFSVATSEVNLRLTNSGEIEAVIKPDDLTVKILLIADKFKTRLDRPSEVNV